MQEIVGDGNVQQGFLNFENFIFWIGEVNVKTPIDFRVDLFLVTYFGSTYFW